MAGYNPFEPGGKDIMIINPEVIADVYNNLMINVSCAAEEIKEDKAYVDEKMTKADEVFWDNLLGILVSGAMSDIDKESLKQSMMKVMGS